MAFANKLKKYRTDLKLKQEELADKIGVSQKTISSWETGRSEPVMGEVVKLCKIFDCSIADLTETREKKVGEITIEDIYAKLPTMEMESIRHLITYAEKICHQKSEKQYLEDQILNLRYQLEILNKKYEDLK